MKTIIDRCIAYPLIAVLLPFGIVLAIATCAYVVGGIIIDITKEHLCIK